MGVVSMTDDAAEVAFSEDGAAPGLVVLSARRPNGDLLLVIRGDVEGRALGTFSDALEAALSSGAPQVHLDLGGVEHWSLLAQAMLLTAARRLAHQGNRLVLHRLSRQLRDESRALGVPARIATTSDEVGLAE